MAGTVSDRVMPPSRTEARYAPNCDWMTMGGPDRMAVGSFPLRDSVMIPGLPETQSLGGSGRGVGDEISVQSFVMVRSRCSSSWRNASRSISVASRGTRRGGPKSTSHWEKGRGTMNPSQVRSRTRQLSA